MAASSKQSKTLTSPEKDAVLDQLAIVLAEDGLKPKPREKQDSAIRIPRHIYRLSS
jgi:hypothetical protein